MRYIVDDIATVVNSLKSKDGGGEIIMDSAPFYQYGRRVEIANRLAAMDRLEDKKAQKYPVIALILDTDEDVNALTNWNLTIVIATLTTKTWYTDRRYAERIKPVLVPLYERLLVAIRTSGLFVWEGYQPYPPHVRTIRPYWGTSEENKNTELRFDDPLDAIEITELKINSTNKPNCL